MESWGGAYSIECDRATGPLKSVQWKIQLRKQVEDLSAECDKNITWSVFIFDKKPS
jgi:hypothetical protein